MAINDNGQVVEVHKSQTQQKLWYHTGQANQMHVDWNNSTYYDTGVDPSVAMNDNGKVIEVHKSETQDAIYYHVGQMAGGRVDWGPSVEYDKGVNPDVAIDNSNWCVEVHKSQANDTLWYHVGNVNGQKISWGNSIHYDGGVTPQIAVNNNNVIVEVHKSQFEDRLFYHVGIINKNRKEIDWGPSIPYDTGVQPSIAITDDNFTIETHKSEAVGQIYRHVGTIDPNNKRIDWSGSVHFDTGQAPAVACSKNGKLAIQTHQAEVNTTLWFSTSLIIDRYRWMEAMYDSLKSKQLWQVTLPASHDTGAYNMTTEIATILPIPIAGAGIRPYSETHNTTMAEQLANGIRVFDLRPYFNFLEKSFYAYHAVIGASFDSIFNELADFLNSTSKELVILEISHFEHFNDTVHGSLINFIKSKIGYYLAKKNVRDLLTTSIESFVTGGSRVIIFYKNDYIDRNSNDGFYGGYDDTDFRTVLKLNGKEVTRI